MIPGFQAFSDSNGNLWIADGWVSQLRSGIRLAAGSGQAFPPLLIAQEGSRFVAAAPAHGGTFVGGSGRNLVTTGLTPTVSGPTVPVGIWQPQRPNVWTLGIFTLTKTGSSTANISDGTNTVASQTSGSAPVGSFASTSYGQTTYNGGGAFTITSVAEQGAPGTIPGCVCTVSAGTAQEGNYTPSSAIASASASDASWTVLVNADGTADLSHSGTIVASRAAGSPCEMAGVYEANSTGMATFNSSLPWRAFFQVVPAVVRAGFAYITLTETAGVLSAVSGPDFSTALPADSSTVFHVPVAQSDGLGGLLQIHTGLLIWQSQISTAAAGSLAGNTLNSTVIYSSLTTLGTVISGTWNAGVISGAYGGTGVNNGLHTITLNNSNFAVSGTASAIILASSGAGTVTYTMPTNSATIARTDAGQTFAGSQTFSGKVAGTGQGTTAALGTTDFTTRSLAAAEWLFGVGSQRIFWPDITYAFSYGSASVSISPGFAKMAIPALSSASSMAAFGIANSMNQFSADTGGNINTALDLSFALQCYVDIVGAANGCVRMLVGGASPNGAQRVADAAPIIGQGYGAEWYYNTTNSRPEVRLFYWNGSASVYAGSVAWPYTFQYSNTVILAKNGGTLSLYVSSGITSRPALLTSTTGLDTSGAAYAGAWASMAIAGHSTVAMPAGTSVAFRCCCDIRFMCNSGL